jgi:hypothetical protein
VVAGVCVLGEASDDLLEHVAHRLIGNVLRAEVDLGELAHDARQAAVLVHLLDLLVELEPLEDSPHVEGERPEVGPEVPVEVLRVAE